jgi:hypothetical protein
VASQLCVLQDAANRWVSRTNATVRGCTLEQVPPAVKATLEREAKGSAVKEIEKTIQDGKTVYEATIAASDGEHELVLADDGTVIKTRAQKDDEDDDD